MRILCLHGRGTYGAILETQIESFRRLLPDDYEYVFVDGEKEHEPAPGVETVFPGPYASYLTDYAVVSMAEQHEFILQIVKEEGPFDAVLGFSQGAALAGSILLHHQIEQPFVPPPFRVAIFISSIYCYSRSPATGVDVTDIVPVNERLANHAIRRLTPDSVKAKILIPTAHIYGANDSMLRESLDLVEMCEDSFARTYMHSGGHDIPMDVATSKKICETIEIAVGRSHMLT